MEENICYTFHNYYIMYRIFKYKEDKKLKDTSRELIKRLLDLANKSYKQNMFTFTDFLSEGEMSDFYQNKSEFDFVKYTIFGGYEASERNIIRFGDSEELGYEEEFPIVCIKITPILEKFSEQLSHRDYLGAIMNLGIDRGKTGDILVKNKVAYLFCKKEMEDFIMENLYKIRHTNITLTQVDKEEAIGESDIEAKEFLVASERIDGVISGVYNKSRSQCVNLFREHKVFVNGKLYENNSGVLKENDMVSVRGFGRFRYMGVVKSTAKGKYRIEVLLYK